MKKIFAVLLACLSLAIGQNDGSIIGIVIDNETKSPSIGANVLIRGTFWGAATDENGEFNINHIPFGRYTITVTVIGYKPYEEILVLSAEKPTVRVSAKLEREVIQSSQIVVTASRSEQNIMDLPLSVSLVSPRKIMEKNVISLEKALMYEPGVTLIKNQLNIRGASGYTMGAGSRSLLLLDGLPLMGSASGNITWNVIPVSEIDRVEIVKSGGSAMYGSGAMGGVVNIITRNAPPKPETRLRLLSGFYSRPKYDQWQWRDSHGRFSTLEITHSLPIGRHGAWFRLQRNQTDGYTELGWNESWNLTGKTKLNFGNKYSASLYGNFITTNNGVESQWKSPADPFEAPFGAENDKTTGTKLNINSTISAVMSPYTVLHIKGSVYDVFWQNSGTNNDRSEEQKVFGELQGGTKISRRWHVTSGISLQKATIDASIFGSHSTFTQAFYGLLQGKFGHGLSTSLGGRYELFSVDSKENDAVFVPQLALNYHPAKWLSLRTSLAKGFRSPTVAELFSQSQLNVFKVEPNPDLLIESSTSYEIGSTVKFAGVSPVLSFMQIDVALYSSDYFDMIEPTPDSHGIIHFENVTNATISGLDAGLLIRLYHGLIDFQGSYTYLNPVETGSDGNITDTLSYRYRHHFTQTLSLNINSFSFIVDSRHTSRMEKTKLFDEKSTTGRDKRVPVDVWNCGISWVFKRLEVRTRIENIFQQYYVELERNMGEERNFQLSIMMKL